MADTPNDIVVSYSHGDAAWARAFVAALQARGWSVFIDAQGLLAGDEWRQRIEAAIDAAKAVIVLWSAHSVASEFVKIEAARAAGAMVPVRIARVEPPEGFKHVHFIDMIGSVPGALPAALIEAIETRLAGGGARIRHSTVVATPRIGGLGGLLVGLWRALFGWIGPLRTPRPRDDHFNILVADLEDDSWSRKNRRALVDALAEWGEATGLPLAVRALRRPIVFRAFLGDEEKLKVARAAHHWLARTGYDVMIWGKWKEAAGAALPAYLLRFATWNPGWHLHGPDKLKPFGAYALQEITIEAGLPGKLAADVGTIVVEAATRFLSAFESSADDTTRAMLDAALVKIHTLMLARDDAVDRSTRDSLADLFVTTVLRVGASLPTDRHLSAARTWIEAHRKQAQAQSSNDPPKWEKEEAEFELDAADRDPEPTSLIALVARRRAAAARIDRVQSPSSWARAQDRLGDALSSLGERQSDSACLEEAVAAFRAALGERTCERAPLDWAATQDNLGSALRQLGRRESRADRLKEAVAAHRAALLERTRDRVPADWATTQSNLAVALENLGDRELGTGHLQQAVAALRSALVVRTRERGPLEWAGVQHRLGSTLIRLGERESGTDRLEAAAAALRAALEELTRERVPLDWSKTQNRLGLALWRLGERESGTARLQEAVAATRAALEENTRERVPLDWSGTQHLLGCILSTLGERASGTAVLEEAVEAFRAALDEATRERTPHEWAKTQVNLGVALASIGERENGTARLEEAIGVLRAALEVFTPERSAYYHDMGQGHLARALALLAERRKG